MVHDCLPRTLEVEGKGARNNKRHKITPKIGAVFQIRPAKTADLPAFCFETPRSRAKRQLCG
jgi:hypothetical protein